MSYPFPSGSPASQSQSQSQSPGQEMRPPRLLAAAKEHLRRPAVQSRISSAKSLFAATKDYLAQKDYRAAYADVSDRVRSAVYTAREYAGALGGESEGEGRRRGSWDEWARERRRRRQEEQRGTERVWLFPGWAIRKPVTPSRSHVHKRSATPTDGPFTLELKVAGYCTSLRPPEQASRAQRAFMRLARSFSALPRLPPAPSGSGSENASLRSYEEGTPPSGAGTPLMSPLLRAVITEEPEDIDLINLDSPGASGGNTPKEDQGEGRYFTPGERSVDPLPSPSRDPLFLDLPTPIAPEPARLTAPAISLSGATPTSPIPARAAPPIPPKPSSLSTHAPTHTSKPPSPSPLSSPSLRPSSPARKPTSLSLSTAPSSANYADIDPEELRTLHANLESRLQPFWASALPGRKVRLTVTLPAPPPPQHSPSPSTVLANLVPSTGDTVLLTTEVTTNAQGFFDERLLVPWDKLLRAGGSALSRLSSVSVRAEMVPLPTDTADQPLPAHPTQLSPPLEFPLPPPPSLRVISDIDDTVKHTGVLLGAKQVFHNVFVRHLDELVLDGVGEWYREMQAWGVGFHYVSNSPYELLPVIREFFDLAGLPHGSIKLKYYSPSAVFTGLWDSAAERKRAGVVEVLDAFPSSKFILIGDTGEQDMELYVQLAQERPTQVVGIFLRDVTPPSWTEGEDIPADQKRPFRRSLSGLSLASTASLSASLPVGGSPLSSPTLEAYKPRRSVPSTPPSPGAHPTPQSPAMPSSVAYLSQAAAQQPAPIAQVKAAEAWRTRLAAARKAVPGGVVFKMFRNVEECGEWRALVERWAGGV